MTSSLTKAFADSQRSLFAAKATVTQATSQMLARGPGGVPTHNPDLAKAEEQLCHYKGWVYASIRPIAQKIAGQPMHVGRRTPNKVLTTKGHQPANVEPYDNHELLDLFADPNDLMVSWSLIYCTVASLELTGRQLWWMPGKEQILPIPTSWIRGFEGHTKFTSFKVQPPRSGETFNLPAEECVYFCYPDPANPHGAVAPLQAVGAAVDADESIQTSQVSMFRRGIHPSHAVIVGKNEGATVRPKLTAAQQRQITSAIRKRYGDVHNHGEPLILDGLIEDVKKLSNTPDEMDWLNSGKATKARIAQGFGTNPIIMGEIEGANRASSHVADQHFCDWTVNPKIELISQTLTEYLRPMFGDELVVWVEPCVPHDADMKYKWAQTLARHGAITGDELRELAPFDLELGNFNEPIGQPARDPQADEAMQKLDELRNEMKTWNDPAYPDRIADQVLKSASLNGRH